MSKVLVLVALLAAACKPETSRRASKAADEVMDQREDVLRKAEALEREANETKPELVKKSVDVLEEAAELTAAQQEFERRKTVRIQAVRAQHEVIATQPMLIATMSKSFRITDAARAEINEKLSVFQMRLDEAANLIQGLHNANADVWEERDDQARDAMKRLEDAREDAWDALDDAPTVDRSAS